jgi:hypothetical protein
VVPGMDDGMSGKRGAAETTSRDTTTSQHQNVNRTNNEHIYLHRSSWFLCWYLSVPHQTKGCAMSNCEEKKLCIKISRTSGVWHITVFIAVKLRPGILLHHRYTRQVYCHFITRLCASLIYYGIPVIHFLLFTAAHAPQIFLYHSLHEESAAVLPGWCHVEWSVALQADHG